MARPIGQLSATCQRLALAFSVETGRIITPNAILMAAAAKAVDTLEAADFLGPRRRKATNPGEAA